MNIITCEFDGIIVIEPKVFGDARGYFFESFNREKFATAGITADFVQDNESFSTLGVLRGLHYQMPPYTQAKLIRVIKGEVLDVAVDIRRDSKTFGKVWTGVVSEANKRIVFLPRGFAHGFVVRSPEVVFSYKCDNFYHPESERCIKLDDPDLAIDWQFDFAKAVLSEKDSRGKLFKEADIPENWIC